MTKGAFFNVSHARRHSNRHVNPCLDLMYTIVYILDFIDESGTFTIFPHSYPLCMVVLFVISNEKHATVSFLPCEKY